MLKTGAICLLIIGLLPALAFSGTTKGFDKVPPKDEKIYGFLKKSGTRAIISTDKKIYTLDWMSFSRVNHFSQDHEKRQAAYMLPANAKIEIKDIPIADQKER